ncbi:MAG: glycosyltransferase [Proteobacteria bacterium]|nr:glycosyltransferase family 2 protein [Desulfobacula sp.]MBU3953059.1 glycosyltransferase [Pseudomonadota bacterium]MBU4132943.1 glycosyltransferase [Pseudomonadota bacterium]
MLKPSIIIPTYNRPRDLEVAIASVLNQTLRPHEIIIVDDGALTDPPLQKKTLHMGIDYIYIRKNPKDRGLTKSRNIGVDRASGDIIFFLDDDVKLFGDFLENSIKEYEQHPDISGMGGGEIFNKKPSLSQKIWFLYDVLFCMTGFKKGYFLRSCFSTNLGNPVLKTKFSRVEFLGGASFSFRKKVFQTTRFSETFQGYGLGEDKDFSYKVSQTHILFANPGARLYHFESPVMRYEKYNKAKSKILSKYAFLTSCNVKGKFSGFWFCYAMAGYLLKRSFLMFLSYDRSEVMRVKGILAGMIEILKSRQRLRHNP